MRRGFALATAALSLAAACTGSAGPSTVVTTPGVAEPVISPTTGAPPPASTSETATTTPAPPSIPLSMPEAAVPTHALPLLVYRPVGGFGGISYVLMVWPDGRYREWGVAGLDIEDVAAIRALADVVPGRSGRIPEEPVVELRSTLDGDVSTLIGIEDDTGCAHTDAVAHGYAFPESAVAFTVCVKPDHEAIELADAIVERIGGLVTSAVVPTSLSEPFESNIRSVVADGGHLVSMVVVDVATRDWSIDLKVVEHLTGPGETAPTGTLLYAFTERLPRRAEMLVLDTLAAGDTMWGLVNREGEVVALAAFDDDGAVVDTGPGRGGLSLGNDGAVFAALGFGSRFGGLDCEFDPEFRPPPAGTYTAAGALLSVLHVWGVRALRRAELDRSHPDWTELVLTIDGAHSDRWLVATNPRRTAVYGFDDLSSAAGPDGDVTFAFPFPLDAALQLWELDRAVLEPAGCDPQSVREAADLLDSHGTLLVAVPVDAVNERGLTIELATLTYRLGFE